jgi:hypothetical protein
VRSIFGSIAITTAGGNPLGRGIRIVDLSSACPARTVDLGAAPAATSNGSSGAIVRVEFGMIVFPSFSPLGFSIGVARTGVRGGAERNRAFTISNKPANGTAMSINDPPR